ncbi:MAG: response regulator [Methylococcaceae bacterium]|nr:response regulator [Methylococcaceae bacterium]MDZ4157368.1 response regulator [Methylococcales bacterium]MDP2392657.1 response regulator [Methylococcaceae bacterium]MDP3021158.1 response regulator [Methylococcaceae bacterium]MDP3390157.1 response regulator [Methylococcaceae bacterium]
MTKNGLPFDILLLEDEPADAYLIKVALEEGKMLANLHHVVDGREGLDFLRHKEQFADAPRPDLILLDFNMPRMNGREFLAEIKADPLLNDIPVIVLTTSDVERDVVASYQLGAASFITKPLDMSQFITAVHHIENYWFTLVRLPQNQK